MDLHLLPLVRRDGQDQAVLPGLYIAPPQRRPARGRQSDRVILYLSLEGNAPLTQEPMEQLLKSLAESYYKTPGSVTAAMRSVIEHLNQYLLDRNLRGASSGYQSLGLFTLLTQRGDRLYLAQCGPVHAFHLAADSLRRIYDPQPERRGLGLGRTAPIYYSQSNLSDNDLLVISHLPPAAWNENTLAGQVGQGLESLRRRLIPLAGNDLDALLILARPGPGKTFLLQPKPLPGYEPQAPEPSPEPSTESTPEATSLPLVEPPGTPVQEPETPPATEEGLAIPELPGEPPPWIPPPAPEEDVFPPITPLVPPQPDTMPPPRYGQAPSPPAEPAIPVARPRRRERQSSFAPAMAAVQNALRQLAGSLGSLLQRMLPGEGLNLPGPLMGLIAVAIPLVVVSIATVIYTQSGRGSEGEAFYAQAVQAAGAAQATTDPVIREQAWLQVLAKLDEAESYTPSPETLALRMQAQAAIDSLNLVQRLEFEPAITEGLPSQTRLSRMLATPTDLYMLDATTGSVYRAIFAGQGYDIDTTYQCGPNFQGSQAIGPLEDVELYAKPDGSGTVLLGLDGFGGLLECTPGAPPLYTVLSPPPAGWETPSALVVSNNDAYVLDHSTRQIWIYRNANFTGSPDLFFDQDIPPLEGAIDLAVDQQDLYILHQDGHVTQCTVSGFGVASTQCTDPAPYGDARPGREGQILIPETAFSQVFSVQPPDPSLYLLEPNTPSLYHFSLRLAYQRQLRPQPNVSINALLGERAVTAFALTPDTRTAFLAFDDQVFYASMP